MTESTMTQPAASQRRRSHSIPRVPTIQTTQTPNGASIPVTSQRSRSLPVPQRPQRTESVNYPSSDESDVILYQPPKPNRRIAPTTGNTPANQRSTSRPKTAQTTSPRVSPQSISSFPSSIAQPATPQRGRAFTVPRTSRRTSAESIYSSTDDESETEQRPSPPRRRNSLPAPRPRFVDNAYSSTSEQSEAMQRPPLPQGRPVQMPLQRAATPTRPNLKRKLSTTGQNPQNEERPAQRPRVTKNQPVQAPVRQQMSQVPSAAHSQRARQRSATTAASSNVPRIPIASAPLPRMPETVSAQLPGYEPAVRFQRAPREATARRYSTDRS